MVAAAIAASAMGFGLAGAGAASAASPETLNLTPGSWTVEVIGGGCEVDTFTSTNTFSTAEFGGDAGQWLGGSTSVAMNWTAGNDTGLLFSGKWVAASHSFKGQYAFGGVVGKAKLVKGAVAGC
jgi:hypothetical protein